MKKWIMGCCVFFVGISLFFCSIQTRAEYEQGKKVAITFDDGPNPDYTCELLSGLKERGVVATFFLLGKEAKTYPDIVRKIKEEGHLIGTHAYEHVNLCHLSLEMATKQVEKTNTIIEELTGERPLFIRPPYGCMDKELEEATTMIEVLWDVDPLDWNTNNADVVTRRVLREVKEGDIILLHDASASSVTAALQIIDALKEKGFFFVTVEELILE